MKKDLKPPPINQSSNENKLTDSPLPPLQIDYELYQQYLTECDLSEDEKKAFIETMWSIILQFVDMGFGVHPIQQACEQSLDLSQVDLFDVLGLKQSAVNEELVQETAKENNNNQERNDR